MEERHEDKARRKDGAHGQDRGPGGSPTTRGGEDPDHLDHPDRRAGGAGAAAGEGGSPGDGDAEDGAPGAKWPDHLADLIALMPAPLRPFAEKPAALMPHELVRFDEALLALYAVVVPQDGQEWWSLIKAAEHAVLGQRYRQVEVKLTAQRARAILRAHLGERHLKRPGENPTRQEVQARNDALADRWAAGDGEARQQVGRLIDGVATEAEIWSQATEIVLDQFGALRVLADRAEAAVRRLLRDVGWLRNLKRLCGKDGVPWDVTPARSLASAAA